MLGRPSGRGATHVVGVIGWPVEHSLSPAIHNAAFAALGLDWVYVPLPVAPGSMRAAADGLVRLGFRGANVTMPHKTESAALADELSEDARRLASGEHVRGRGRPRCSGTTPTPRGSTGSCGATRASTREGRTALLFGAGRRRTSGGVRARPARVSAELTVAVRETPARAAICCAAVEGTGIAVERRGVRRCAERMRADLVVNATPLGADGRTAPPLPVLDAGRAGRRPALPRRRIDTVADRRPRGGRRGVRRPGTPAAPGGAVVRAVDRHPGAARRDVGGRPRGPRRRVADRLATAAATLSQARSAVRSMPTVRWTTIPRSRSGSP